MPDSSPPTPARLSSAIGIGPVASWAAVSKTVDFSPPGCFRMLEMALWAPDLRPWQCRISFAASVIHFHLGSEPWQRPRLALSSSASPSPRASPHHQQHPCVRLSPASPASPAKPPRQSPAFSALSVTSAFSALSVASFGSPALWVRRMPRPQDLRALEPHGGGGAGLRGHALPAPRVATVWVSSARQSVWNFSPNVEPEPLG